MAEEEDDEPIYIEFLEYIKAQKHLKPLSIERKSLMAKPT